MHGKRKKESHEEGSSRPRKNKKKVAAILDEDEVPLSELQKAILLKGTSGVIQQSSKASDARIPGKLSSARNLFILYSHFFESVLPTQTSPFPSDNTLPTHIPIPQPPPTK